MPRGEHKASERRIEAAERQRKALELKKMGHTYETIAQNCGFKNRSGAFMAVKRALEEIVREPAEDVLKLELERLDRLMLGVWPQARDGSFPAIDRVLRIMQQRASLLGIDVRTTMAIEDHQSLKKRIEALESDQQPGSAGLPPRTHPPD